jgi:hypothetical protein
MLTMPWENAAVAVCDSHAEAGAVVAGLQHSDFDMTRVSVAGRAGRANSQVTGCFDDGSEGFKYWGEAREFWAGLWETLSGRAIFTAPGMGLVIVAGPLSGWVAAGLENAPIFGGLSALGAAIYSIGIPRSRVLQYEAALKAGRYLVLVHGAAGEVNRAKEALRLAGAEG